ncbi:MAG: hypothetical protein KDA05_09690 [Phycisphaerales bacterium]|nr:hypothetical protein [Phycisphaerales bacterium]
MARSNVMGIAAHLMVLAGTIGVLATAAHADVSVRGGARIQASHPTGTNDFHIVYDSTLGPFNVTRTSGADNTGATWTGGPGTPPPGSSPTTRQTNFNRAPGATANFSWLDIAIEITGERLCSMRVLDKYWTVNGNRQPQRVGGFGMLQDEDPATGTTRVWVLNDHTDFALRVSNLSFDIFSSAMLPDVDADLELSTPYTYSIPDAILAPGQRVSFTFPRSLVPDEWSTVQGHAQTMNAATGMWEDDGNFRYQHEYLPPVPAPGSAALLALAGLVGAPRRSSRRPAR